MGCRKTCHLDAFVELEKLLQLGFHCITFVFAGGYGVFVCHRLTVACRCLSDTGECNLAWQIVEMRRLTVKTT